MKRETPPWPPGVTRVPEEVRWIHVTVEIETNKRTIVREYDHTHAANLDVQSILEEL